jgi:3-hydroxybutyryl-CoA dehydrogenase
VEIKNITVIGGGTMGNGIAHIFAQYEFNTTLIDTKQEYLNRAINTIKTNLERQVKKGVIAAEKIDKTLNFIKPTTNLEEAKNAQLVIEAVFEDMAVKKIYS